MHFFDLKLNPKVYVHLIVQTATTYYFMRTAGLFFIFLLMNIFSKAQSIKGTLMDPVEGVVVKGATVQLLNPADSSTLRSAVSDSSGNFLFSGLGLGNYAVKASSIGFELLLTSVALKDSMPDVDLGDLYIPKKTTTLEGVVVMATAPAVSQKGDTTQFSAARFKVNPDANVEDLIKKMPGITVDRSGTVTAQGEQVRKVTVDGKDFFGDDATMALRNLPSEVVDKIQVFDRLSDQAQLTGFDDGNAVKAINIVTKGGVKNGQFGRVYAGYGTDDRYAAGGNISFFNGDRRLSFVGNFNNINQQNFASQDLLGVTGSGGGGRGGGRGGGGGADNFSVGQQAGISKTNAFGINFGDKWGKKNNVDIAASYFFNNSTNTNESKTLSQTIFAPDSIRYAGNERYSTSNNNNHRFNMRVEYKIDSNNTIFIIPSISFQDNNSASNGASNSYRIFRNDLDSINSSINRSSSNRNGFNINNNIMYRHSFAKRGRTLSLGFRAGYNKNDGYSYNYNNLNFYDTLGNRTDSLLDQFRDNNTNGYSYNGRIAYTEPIGKQGQIEIEYEREIQKNKADQQTFENDGTGYTIFQPRYSNEFDNTITTNTAEIDYRLGRSRDNQFSIGVDFQNSTLESRRIYPTNTRVNQSFNTFLPNVRWSKKIGVNSSFRLFYRARTDFPSIGELQDVIDISNPLNVRSGNPGLRQSYTNFGSARYSYINKKTNHSFFANIFGQMTNDFITNAVYYLNADSVIQNVTVNQGSQFSKPVNLNGYKQLNTYFTYSFPFQFIKSNLNLNAAFNYTDRPGLINEFLTKTTNTTFSGGLVWGSNISEYVDFNLSYNANFNNAINTYPEEILRLNRFRNTNTKYVNQSAGLFVNLLSKNGWFLTNDVSNQSYSGLSQGFNQSYWLWNAAAGKKFLKQQNGELKLSVFDLLKQNQSITRAVEANNTITDSQSRVLQQYFMLTFTYRLRNFGKGKAPSSGEERGEWRRDGMQGPPPGGGGNRRGGI